MSLFIVYCGSIIISCISLCYLRSVQFSSVHVSFQSESISCIFLTLFYFLFCRHTLAQSFSLVFGLRVEVLLKTKGGYLRDAEVT